MDWVKMRSDIYRDPRVCEMAEQLTGNHSCDRNVMRNATVGALVTFWGVTRHRGHRYGDDLQLPRMKLSVVDSIVELPGFGAAMVAVGWIIERDESLILPRFFEGLNVDPAEKTRVQNAERQRRYRERNRNVTDNVTVTQRSNVEKRRVEKRREDKNTDTALSAFAKPKANCPEGIDPKVWCDWLTVRKQKRRGPPTATAMKKIEREATTAKLTVAQAIQISAEKGWAGFEAQWLADEPRLSQPAPRPLTPPSRDHRLGAPA
jgi:hypothetical protein